MSAAGERRLGQKDAPMDDRRSNAVLRQVIASSFAVGAASAWACGGSSAECQVGADCASGMCLSTGVCATVGDAGSDAGNGKRPGGPDGGKKPRDGDAGVDASTRDGKAPVDVTTTGDTGHTDGSTRGSDAGARDASHLDAPADAATSVDAWFPTGNGDGGLCVPQNNGIITASEYPMMAGLHANYEFADNVTIDTTGVTNPDGSRTWDLTGPYSGDQTVFVTTDAPTGQWFSSNFPGASYTTPLSHSSTLIGVFQGTPSSLVMLGVASPASGLTQTELSYAPPAEFIAVPMKMGSTWSTTSNVTGQADGVFSDYYEEYSSTVDAYGTIKVPYGTFNVLRVQTTLTRTVGVLVTLTQSLAWVAECFGPVASATSQADETSTQFTDAAEVRRLTP